MTDRSPTFAVTIALALAAGTAFAAEPSPGMIRVESAHPVAETLDRVEAAIREKGLKVFGRIDHAAAAKDYGLEMPPTVVFIFGNPKMGTPAMIRNPLSAIDFPLKGLVYEDSEGRTWIAYNSADYVFGEIFARHGLPYTDTNVANYATLLGSVTATASR